MEKRLAFLLNSCKAGNIFEAEGEELKSLIDEYFLSDGNQCSERPEGDSESSDCDSESDDNERRTENQLPDFVLAESEFDDVGELEIEEPIVHISGPGGDEQMDDCNGAPPPELLRKLRQFSCNCKQIKVTPAAEDPRRGCVTQFTTEEIMGINLSIKDMDRDALDMLILGLISSCRHTGDMTQTSRCKEQRERQKGRSTYMYMGRLVCVKTFQTLLG
ncbi:hypothetical protein V1264_018067 [Littorina saxatilis]|uniref:Uncharacterized protein n=1 Tax=Littorina saxatilis TaxID=31220 RepID=A0AAN9BH02_9CAEN